jgi:hypothetical protein
MDSGVAKRWLFFCSWGNPCSAPGVGQARIMRLMRIARVVRMIVITTVTKAWFTTLLADIRLFK